MNDQAERYARWLVENRSKQGTPEFEAVKGAYIKAREIGPMSLPVRTAEGMSATMPNGSVIGREGQTVYDAAADQTGKGNPTEGMGTFEKYRAGVQGDIANRVLAGAQMLGLASQADADAKNRTDAPLAATTAGKAGFLTVPTAAGLALSAVPGANTVVGSAAIGAGLGAFEPVGSGGDMLSDRLANMAGGAGAGALGQLTGNVIATGARFARDTLAPLTAAGKRKAAAEILQQAAQDPQRAAQAALTYQAATPGVSPTLAQATLDPGLAALERSAGANGGADIAAQRLSNRGALLDVLKRIAGTDAEYATAVATRDAAVEPAYASAFAQRAQISPARAPLFERPAMVAARKLAADVEANAGRPSSWLEETGPGSLLTGEQAHSLKMALDSMLEPNPSAGLNSAQARGVRAARGDYLDWLESQIPDYKVARTTHAWMSPDINQRDVGRTLLEKLQPALVSGEETAARLTPNSFATALRDADAVARKATDWGGARWQDIMTPEQSAAIAGVRSDLGREATALDVAMTPGSPTKQNLDYELMRDDAVGMLRRNSLARAVLSAANLPARYTKRAVDDMVTQGMLNPSTGADLLTYRAPVRNDFLLESLRRLSGPAGLTAYTAQQ